MNSDTGPITLASGTYTVNTGTVVSSGLVAYYDFNTCLSGATFTAPISGFYRIMAKMQWDANGSGYRYTYLHKTGETLTSSTPQYFKKSPESSGITEQQAERTVYLTAGQTLSVFHYQDSGSNFSVTTDVCFEKVK